MYLPRRFALLLAPVILLAPLAAQALSVVYVDLDELVAQSDAVVLATVVGERYDVLPSHGVEITETEIEIEEILFGDAPAELEFRKLGGATPIPGVERFEPGERTVLFLRFADGHWWLTALGQSKMTLTDGPLGEVATRNLHVSAYVKDDAGRLRAYRPISATRTLPMLREDIGKATTARKDAAR